jgi:hypothetical protein
VGFPSVVQMKTLIAVSLMMLLAACATSGRPGEATRTARDAIASCAPGYVEYPAGSGVCQPYNDVQQQQAGPIRQTVGGVMAQPMPTSGGLLHR